MSNRDIRHGLSHFYALLTGVIGLLALAQLFARQTSSIDLATLLAFTLMALTASLALPAEDSSYQHYLRAGYYIQSGRLEQAIAELQKSIEADPDAAAPHVTLGRVLLGLNRPDEALEALEKAERLDPADAEVPKMVGRVYLQLAATDAAAGYASKAEEAFKRALELDPEEQESLFYLALLYGVDPSPVATIQDFKAKLSTGA